MPNGFPKSISQTFRVSVYEHHERKRSKVLSEDYDYDYDYEQDYPRGFNPSPNFSLQYARLRSSSLF
jgi:hypothetical protein